MKLEKSHYFLLLLLFFITPIYSQIDLRRFDYSKADSSALNFPQKKYKSYTEIVGPLVQNFNTDHEKFRVVFRWIAENVKYSYANRSSDPEKVIKTRKAVCAGYASLLKAMCNSVGIECEEIYGFSKTEVSEINKSLKRSDHAWNSVKLDGVWYLVDVTWAAGYLNDRRRFVKSFNELYFLADPDFFQKKHFPEDKKWFLDGKRVSKSQFRKSPIYYSNLITSQISLITPKSGLLKLNLNEAFKLEFISNENVSDLGYSVFPHKFVSAMVFEKVPISDAKFKYLSTIKFKKKMKTTLTIFVNGSSVLTYKVIIK